MSKVKKASINKLKTFKTAFGENCDVFSNNSYEVVPKIKEDRMLQKNYTQLADVGQKNKEVAVTLEQLIALVYF